MSELVVDGLRYERGGQRIFDDLNFTARSGERVAVLGASGSGKTSLLALLAGFTTPSAGTMTLDGQPLTAELRRGFAVVLQGYGLVSLLTATENIEAALRAAGRPTRTATATAEQALAELGLSELAEHLVEELSGGQQQRVAVARALALEPTVLLADEPTAEQDPASRAIVLDRLLQVTDRGGILVLATHDPVVAARCTATVHIRPETELAG